MYVKGMGLVLLPKNFKTGASTCSIVNKTNLKGERG